MFFTITFSFAQNSTKFNCFFGYGLYDGVNVGIKYKLKNEARVLNASVGYEHLFSRKQEIFTLGIGLQNAIFKESKNKLNQYKWNINSRILLWQLKDDFYLWRFISFTPSISYKFIVLKKHNLLFDIGPIFNIVVHSKRLTFEEIGWPQKVMPNFRIIFIL